MWRVGTPHSGIFALGTASHAYLEFDVVNERNGAALVAVIASLREPRTTMGVVNLVAGFRPASGEQAVERRALARGEGAARAVAQLPVGADAE